jgi:Lrp/AsnC family transcriptional regulator, regulator for asnA, asnC and gidA
MSTNFDLDQLDRQIVRLLQTDGRRPFREIARELDISEKTVRARIKRLQDAEALRFLAMIDPGALGNSVLWAGLIQAAPGYHDELVAALVALPEVGYVATTFGRTELIIEVTCRTNADAYDFFNNRLRSLEGVIAVEANMLLKVHKYKYDSEYI